MYDCIYSPHCTYKQCDLACPIHAEISYWMDRCNISINNPVLKSSALEISNASKILENNNGHTIFVKSSDTIKAANLLSYCAICLHGIGTGLSNGIYNLNISSYLEEIKRSWQTKSEPDELVYMRIWANSAKYLVISHLDYINFGNFESQTLLTLIQQRTDISKTTIVVIPKDHRLILNSAFGNHISKMSEGAVTL